MKGPGLISRALGWPCIGLIWVYRLTLSPLLGGQCRFEPTCSRYAEQAYRRFGVVIGTRLTIARVVRCHPLSRRPAYDPVPLEWPDGKESSEACEHGKCECGGGG